MAATLGENVFPCMSKGPRYNDEIVVLIPGASVVLVMFASLRRYETLALAWQAI
jgi:hypothetical protein